MLATLIGFILVWVVLYWILTPGGSPRDFLVLRKSKVLPESDRKRVLKIRKEDKL